MKQNALPQLFVLSLLVVFILATGCAPPMKFENESGRYAQASEPGVAIPSGSQTHEERLGRHEPLAGGPSVPAAHD